MRPSLLAGAEAADEILALIAGTDSLTAKASARRKFAGIDPLHPGDFIGLVDRLSGRIFRAARAPTRETLEKALKLAIGGDWTTGESAGAELEAMSRALMGMQETVPPAIVEALAQPAAEIAVATRASVARALKAKLTRELADRDLRAIEHLRTSQSHFLTDEIGERVKAATGQARVIVAEGVAGGLDSKAIGKRLATTLEGVIEGRGEVYYDTVASVFTARARTYASVATYAEQGVRRLMWRSIRDKRTTQQCLFLDGKIFQTAATLERLRSVESLDDPDDVREMLPWPRMARVRADRPISYEGGHGKQYDVKPGQDRRAIYYMQGGQRRLLTRVDALAGPDTPGRYVQKIPQGELEASGIMPPCHPRCRSTLVPVTR